MEDSLFKDFNPSNEELIAPLADRMRPESIDEVLGQEHILGKGKILRTYLERRDVPSIVFWGPPGSGKTTIAYLIAKHTNYLFLKFSAVTSGIQEIKKLLKEIEKSKKKAILFIDEIHRFNKLQQDAFLPYIEKGNIILIGATTENPSFELNNALLSRIKVLTLAPLKDEHIKEIINRALTDEVRGLGKLKFSITDEALSILISYASGDARVALNALEMATNSLPNGEKTIDEATMKNVLQKKIPRYDKLGDMHYDLISALHKSLRGSDVDAALYYLVRILDAGEDPLFVARRLLRFASEDVGLADPFALTIATSTFYACSVIGMPECDCILAELTIYLALAPKSNSSYEAILKVREEIEANPYEEVPLFIRNAPTRLMKDLGYGKGYIYPHDVEGGIISENYLPLKLKDRIFYNPKDAGKEKELKKRLEEIREILRKK